MAVQLPFIHRGSAIRHSQTYHSNKLLLPQIHKKQTRFQISCGNGKENKHYDIPKKRKQRAPTSLGIVHKSLPMEGFKNPLKQERECHSSIGGPIKRLKRLKHRKRHRKRRLKGQRIPKPAAFAKKQPLPLSDDLWLEILTFINCYDLWRKKLFLVSKQWNALLHHPYLYTSVVLNYEDLHLPYTKIPIQWLQWIFKEFGTHMRHLHLANIKLHKQLCLSIHQEIPHIQSIRLNNVDPAVLLCYHTCFDKPLPFQLEADNQQLFSWCQVKTTKNCPPPQPNIHRQLCSWIHSQRLTWTKQFRIHLRYRKKTCSICIHPSLPLSQSLYEPLLASGWFDRMLHQFNIHWSHPSKLSPVESLHRIVMCLLVGVLPKPIALDPSWSGRRLFPPTFQPLHETTLFIRNRRIADFVNIRPPM